MDYLPLEKITRDLAEPSFQKYASSLLLKFNISDIPQSPSLIYALLKAARFHEEANLVLVNLIYPHHKFFQLINQKISQKISNIIDISQKISNKISNKNFSEKNNNNKKTLFYQISQMSKKEPTFNIFQNSSQSQKYKISKQSNKSNISNKKK